MTRSPASAVATPPENRRPDIFRRILYRLVDFNLSWAIGIFAGFVVLVLWGSLIYKLEVEREQASSAVYRENANLARAFEEHTIRTLKSVDQAVLFLKFQYEKFGNKINIADYVREGMLITTIFNQLGIIDEHGMYILSSLPDFKKVDLSDRPHFQVHKDMDSNELFVSRPVLGRASGKWSIQLTRRINKKDGSFGGAVTVSLDPFYFSSFYSGVNLGAQGSVTLVGKDGVVRARRVGENMTVGQDLSKSQFTREIMKGSQGSYIGTSAIDGVRRLYSYREVKGYPFYVVVGVGEAEALADFEQRRRGYLLFASMVTLATIGFSVVLIVLVKRRRQIEQSLRESRVRAESANRMKSEFLASMSHELRTPLNGILGYAEFLRDNSVDQTHKEFASTILDSGQHLLEVVNSILDLAKVEAGKMELVLHHEPVRPLLESVMATYRPMAESRGLKLELSVAPDLPDTIFCDRTRLIQVLNNLVHNAIKFTDEGGVAVEASATPAGTRFGVSDTGCGMDPAVQSYIFDKFRQADQFVTRRHGGTGLGLSLVRELVGLMGGQIDLESAPGTGTRVHFTLPADSPDSFNN